MARPAGQMLEVVPAERPDDISRRSYRAAVEHVRAELEELVKSRCGVRNPPPYKSSSKNGEYPKARTYEFHDGLRVVYSEENDALRIYSKTHDHHGVFLQNGLRDGTTRPYATLALQERDWNARINALARKMNR